MQPFFCGSEISQNSNFLYLRSAFYNQSQILAKFIVNSNLLITNNFKILLGKSRLVSSANIIKFSFLNEALISLTYKRNKGNSIKFLYHIC